MMSTRTTAILLVLAVAGCGDREPAAPGPVGADEAASTNDAAEVPSHAAGEVFRYGAMAERNPFEPFAELPGGRASKAPDLARRRQPQERFPLGQLEMVGTLAGRGATVALIRDPEGNTRPLAVGDFLGRDHGRITEIRETGIDIQELVEDDEGGWKVRPRTLELAGTQDTVDPNANHEGENERENP